MQKKSFEKKKLFSQKKNSCKEIRMQDNETKYETYILWRAFGCDYIRYRIII